jgi:phosphatidylinositol-3-phosphatase
MRAGVIAIVSCFVSLVGCASTSAAKDEPSTTIATPTSVARTSTTQPKSDTTTSTSPPASTTTGPSTSRPLDVDATEPCGQPDPAPRTYDHVVWIWMENKNSNVLSSPLAHFLSSMAAACGSASNYSDNGVHPSLPNYLLATSGDVQGVHDDGEPKKHTTTADNIFRQVRASGGSAKSYLESMDHNCQLGSTGRYAVKHNPAAYYTGGDDRAACERDDLPFDAFASDLSAGKLPSFAFIAPNLCHDGHDCSIKEADNWLRTVVSSITDSPTYKKGRTAVFVVWDESVGSGHMPFLAIAPSIPKGTVADAPLGHAALLAFTERALGVRERLGAAAGAGDLGAAFGL